MNEKRVLLFAFKGSRCILEVNDGKGEGANAFYRMTERSEGDVTVLLSASISFSLLLFHSTALKRKESSAVSEPKNTIEQERTLVSIPRQ